MIAKAIAAPLVETIDGRSISLPILTLADLAKIGREVLNARMATEIADCSLTDNAGRSAIQNFYRTAELDIDEYCRMAASLENCARFIAASLAKAGEPSELVESIRIERGHRGLANLSAEVSGLWAPNLGRKAKEPPNVGTAGAKTDGAPAESSQSTST